MITWSAHLMPNKNVIRMYRRTNNLKQTKSDNPDNRKEITHTFKNLTKTEMFEEAEKILEESGYEVYSQWERDWNFEIWYIKVREKTEELV